MKLLGRRADKYGYLYERDMSDEIGPVVVFFSSFFLFLSLFCSYSCGKNGDEERYFLIHNVQ